MELKSSLTGSETSTPRKPEVIQEIEGQLLGGDNKERSPGTSVTSGTPEEEIPSNVFETVLNELKGIFVTKALQQAEANTAFDARIIELESLLAFKAIEINQVRWLLSSDIIVLCVAIPLLISECTPTDCCIIKLIDLLNSYHANCPVISLFC